MKKNLFIVLSLIIALMITSCDLKLADKPVFANLEEINEAGFSFGFAGGNGSEENPFLINSAEQFKLLGSDAIQSLLALGKNDNLHFRLTADIDLRNQVGVVGRFISGTLDGNGHTIYGGNGMPYIFQYFLEDTSVKNLNIVFDSEGITKLFGYPAVILESPDPVSGAPTRLGYSTYYEYDKELLTLNLDGVTFTPSNVNHYYTIGDANFAFFAHGTNSALRAFYNGEDQDYKYFAQLVAKGEDGSYKGTYYKININNCHVTGNYIGGFSDSGAAIFIGGQLEDAQVNISNSSFSGNLVGRNVSLVAANRFSCSTADNTKITLSNVSGSIITSYIENLGSLYFANDNGSSSAIIEGTATGEFVKGTYNMTINGPVRDTDIVVTNTGVDNASRYEMKFYLPTVYWYENSDLNNYAIQTNSNVITFSFGSEEEMNNAKLQAVKVVARDELIAQGKDVSWSDVKLSVEGKAYIFTEIDGERYLAIDYNDSNYKYSYSDIGLNTDLKTHSYVKSVLVVAYNDSNGLEGLSRNAAVTTN